MKWLQQWPCSICCVISCVSLWTFFWHIAWNIQFTLCHLMYGCNCCFEAKHIKHDILTRSILPSRALHILASYHVVMAVLVRLSHCFKHATCKIGFYVLPFIWNFCDVRKSWLSPWVHEKISAQISSCNNQLWIW